MYKKIEASQVPKRRRLVASRFEATPEWKAMKADLDKGLKPKDALVVTLTDDEMCNYGILNRRTVGRFLQRYVAARNLPYRVRVFNREATGWIVVEHPSKKSESKRSGKAGRQDLGDRV
jgi:hypothetical protein